MSDTFKALRVHVADKVAEQRLDTLTLSDLPEQGVLVRVHWSSLNYKDALSATGNKGVTRHFPHTPGIDAVGVVESADSGPFSTGDWVICTGYDLGMNTAGGYGDYIRVPADWLVALPESLSPHDAMVLGTAGLTAALCVESLLGTGLQLDQGPVLVTGASGGVGAISVDILAKLGFEVTAVSGKPHATQWLKDLGASEVISRETLLENAERPLLKPQWAGVVDCVGGEPLVAAIKGLHYGASAACCGLVASPNINLTVLPFILRGVNLLGVDSVELPRDIKDQMWQLLAHDWRPQHLDLLQAAEVSREELTPWINDILQSKVQGRVVVKVA